MDIVIGLPGGVMFYFILWLVLAALVAKMASTRGRDAFAWFFISVLASPVLGFLVLVLMADLKEQKAAAMADLDSKVCPRCAEKVKSQALVCRFCGYEFEAVSAPDSIAAATAQASPVGKGVPGMKEEVRTVAIVGGMVAAGLIGMLVWQAQKPKVATAVSTAPATSTISEADACAGATPAIAEILQKRFPSSFTAEPCLDRTIHFYNGTWNWDGFFAAPGMDPAMQRMHVRASAIEPHDGYGWRVCKIDIGTPAGNRYMPVDDLPGCS